MIANNPAITITPNWARRSTVRRSKRSTMTPTGSAKISSGIPPANPVKPTKNGESVISSASHPTAT